MRKISKLIFFTVLGTFFFLMFFYLSFPYHVLKEVIVSKLSSSSQMFVSIEELNPKFPLGFDLNKISIKDPGASDLSFNKLSVSFDTLYLFMGQASISLYLEDKNKGNIQTNIRVGLLDLITGGNEGIIIPSNIKFNSSKFKLSDIINFVLTKKANSPDTDLLVKPLLESIKITGFLNTDFDFKINTQSFSKSEGVANLSLADAKIIFDPSMELPDQVFEKAVLTANFSKGLLTINPNSIFTSSDLKVSLNGSVQQKAEINKSVLDIDLNFELRNKLKEQFEFVLDAFTQQTTNGVIKLKVAGTLTNSNVVFQ